MQLFILVLLTLVLPSTAFSQSQNLAAAFRDPQALAAVSASIQALGGNQAFARISDVTGIGVCHGQQRGGLTSSGTVRWITSGQEFLFESTSDSARSAMGSGHGSPWTLDRTGTVSNRSERAAPNPDPFYFPGLLLYRLLNDPTKAFQLVGSEELQGKSVLHVAVEDTWQARPVQGTVQDWYFDPVTSLPVRYVYRVPTDSIPKVLVEVFVTFSQFQTFGNFVSPAGLTTGFVAHDRVKTCVLSSLDVNSGPNSSLFDKPGAGAQ